MVYEDAEVLYAEVKKDGEAILEEALCVLFPGSVPVLPSMRSKSLGGSSKIIALNTTFFPRWDIIRIPSLGKAGPALKSLFYKRRRMAKKGMGLCTVQVGDLLGS
jgi:alpha-mannosidase